MAKYLDENGLLYFWTKIKNFVSGSVVQSDWDETDATSKSYILNKPTIPEGSVIDANLSDTSTNAVQNRTVKGALDGKVDKVTGKGLSTEDYTAAEKTKLRALPDNSTLQSTYALKSEITNMYKYKGSVANASALPSSGQTTGDVYNIEAASVYGGAGMNVAWNGTAWDPLGEIFSVTSITNAEIDTIVAS